MNLVTTGLFYRIAQSKNMKSRFKIYLSLLLVFSSVLISCSDTDAPNIDNPSIEKGRSVLYLNTGETVSTRATLGEDTYNENRVDRIDLFFFTDNNSDEESILQIWNESITRGDRQINGTSVIRPLTFAFPIDKKDELFGDSKSAKVYAVVNCPSAKIEDLKKCKTISDLKSFEIQVDETGVNAFYQANAPTNFVMFSQNAQTVTYKEEDEVIEGNIQVSRVAAKIRMAISVEDEIYLTLEGDPVSKIEGESDEQFEERIAPGLSDGSIVKWVPNKNAMRVFISDGVTSARMDGSVDYPDKKYYSILTSESGTEFNMSRLLQDPANSTQTNLPAAPDGYPYYNFVPYYSYPNNWSTEINEAHRTYLTLMVPWSNTGNGNATNYQNTYYTVPINKDGNELKSNTYYKIKLNVGMLGSFKLPEATDLDASYIIEEWGKEEMDVVIKDFRYLVVNQKNWIINNQETVSIPFSSSHDTEITNVEVTYFRYYDSSQGDNSVETPYIISKTQFDNTKNANQGEMYTYGIEGNNIVFNMPLWEWTNVNNQGAKVTTNYGNSHHFVKNENKSAYSRYEIKITIVHEDQKNEANTQFKEDIYLTIYPPMYIINEYNPGNYSSGNNIGVLNRGYVSVNANTNLFGGASTTNASNTNHNMYVITTTQFNINDETTKDYNIGDPRTIYYNNILSNNSFTTYANKNTEENGLPLRWSNNDDSPNGNGNNGTQTFDSETTPAWFYQRQWTRGGNNQNRTYTYNSYTYIPSLYADLKPTNTGSNTSSQNWNYINHKNNLCFYYPTEEYTGSESARSKKNMIAPKFRIASSYGVTSAISKEDARKRCATYQEAGYPAGRWRVPTQAEVKYIIQLSAEGKIPRLFGSDPDRFETESSTDYWSAPGYVTTTTNRQGTTSVTTSDNDGNTTRYVRCVYDEWYWVKEDGETPDRLEQADWGKFTWGDKLKVNPQE